MLAKAHKQAVFLISSKSTAPVPTQEAGIHAPVTLIRQPIHHLWEIY